MKDVIKTLKPGQSVRVVFKHGFSRTYRYVSHSDITLTADWTQSGRNGTSYVRQSTLPIADIESIQQVSTT